jgi:hypothetical protein
MVRKSSNRESNALRFSDTKTALVCTRNAPVSAVASMALEMLVLIKNASPGLLPSLGLPRVHKCIDKITMQLKVAMLVVAAAMAQPCIEIRPSVKVTAKNAVRPDKAAIAAKPAAIITRKHNVRELRLELRCLRSMKD